MNTLDKCEIDNRKNLCKNLVLAGGSTIFKGFPERLKYELSQIN